MVYNYFSTGDPSEPNYLALGGADDWGQTGDEAFLPAVQGVKPNLWNAIDAAGLTWHVYEGSLWPSPAGTQQNIAGATSWNQSNGGLWFDNPAECSIVGADGSVTYYGSVAAMKHNPAVWYADAAAQPDFASNYAQRFGRVWLHRCERQCDPVWLPQQYQFDQRRQLYHRRRLGQRAADLRHREQHHLLVDREHPTVGSGSVQGGPGERERGQLQFHRPRPGR